MPNQVFVWVLLAAGHAYSQPHEYLEALRFASEKQYDQALGAFKESIRSNPAFGRAYPRMVAISREAGQLESARAYLEALAAEGHNPYAYYGAAIASSQGKDPEAAEKHLIACINKAPEFLPAYSELATLAHRGARTSAVALLERMSRESSGSGGPQFGLGYLHFLKSEYPRALEILARAAALRPDAIEIADARYFAYYSSNRHSEALAVARGMLSLAVEANDVEWQGRLHGRAGMIELDLGDLGGAASDLEKAVGMSHEIGNRSGEQIFRGNLGAVYARLARYPDALKEYRESLRLSRETGDRLSEGRNLGLLAAIYADMADYSRAAGFFNQSIEIARESGDRGSEAAQLARLSLLYEAFGDHARALQSVERALRVAREEKNPWLEGRFLEILGVVYRNLGKPRDALLTHQRGLEVARRIGSQYAEASARRRLGEAHAALGEYALARDCYDRALGLAEHIGARTIQAATLNGIGRVELRAGVTSSAARSYGRALEIAKEIRSPEITWQAHAGLASALTARSPKEALSHYRAALEAVEQVRTRVSLAEDRAGFFEDKIQVHRDLIGLLMSLHAREPSGGHDAEAFRIAERAHARSFLDLLSEAKPEASADVALSGRRRVIETAIARLQSRLMAEHAKAKPEAAKLTALDVELSTAAEEHAQVLRRTRERAAADAGLSTAEPITLHQARQLLEPGTVLLEYSLGERASYLFAVSGTRYVVARLPAAGVLATRVRKLREAIAARPTTLSLSNYVLQAKLLYRDLIAPAAALASRSQKWIVVPDGVLHYLPFEALLEPGELDPEVDPSKLSYLVRKHAISYVPSASVLAALRQNRRNAGAAGKSLVAFADPIYPGNAENPRGVALRSAVTSSASQLRRLPQTRREVQAIAEWYPSKKLFLGDKASEEQVKMPGALDAGVVQFAVHGLVNEARPQFSGLALSLPPGDGVETAVKEDGLLQVYEILGLRMNADLVVLSACETGLGRDRQGEGLTGLTQAFLHAGAASVVVSLWKVEDGSTADLMIGFHRHLASGAPDKAQALRMARLDLIQKGGGLAHPYYWAPFVLVGVPR